MEHRGDIKLMEELWIYLPFFFRYNWHITHVHLRDTMWWVDTRLYFEVIITSVWISTSISSHNYHFFSMVGTLKIYSLSNFQMYNTVLLTVVTMLPIRSPEIMHLIPESSYSWTRHLSMFPCSARGNHHSAPWFHHFDSSESVYKWCHMVFAFLCLNHFS